MTLPDLSETCESAGKHAFVGLDDAEAGLGELALGGVETVLGELELDEVGAVVGESEGVDGACGLHRL